MSRGYEPGELLDPRVRHDEETGDTRQTHQQHEPRGRPSLERPALDRSRETRKTYRLRDRNYRLRSSEIHTLGELGKFRAVAAKDLEEFAYVGERHLMRADVRNLLRQGLVSEKAVPHQETSPRRLLTLTKEGHRLLKATKSVPTNQSIHHGFAKPREAHHDADLYRLYHTAAEKIQREGGRNLRVVLDYELKKRIYGEIAKRTPDRNRNTHKEDIAEKHGLKVVRGKIPLPDLRVEYETPEGEMARLDLELATEHYRARNLAEKAQAGFSIYAHPQDAPGLRRVMDEHELTAEILNL